MLAYLRSANAVAREAAARDAMVVPRPSRARAPGRERAWYAVRVGAVALVVAAGYGSSAPAATAPATTGGEGPGGVGEAAQGDVAGLVDVGNGHSIYRACRGSGSPTVVLVSGLGERADTWMATSEHPAPTDAAVFPGVAGFTRVCAYDRPGTATATEAGFALTQSTSLKRSATVADSAVDLE